MTWKHGAVQGQGERLSTARGLETAREQLWGWVGWKEKELRGIKGGNIKGYGRGWVCFSPFFFLAQSCSSPSFQKPKVKYLCTVVSLPFSQPRKAIYCFTSSLPIILALQNRNQRRGAENQSLFLDLNLTMRVWTGFIVQ